MYTVTCRTACTSVIVLSMTDDHYATVYLFNKEECLWSFARTSALNHACLPASVRESITTAARIGRKSKKAGEPEKGRRKGKHNNGKPI